MVQVIPPNYFPGVSRSTRSPKGRTGETGKITLPEVSRNGQNGQNGEASCNPIELYELAELGRKFRAQQSRGRRPGFLRQHVAELVKRARSPMTFEALLQELELEAALRESDGERASPVEKVDRIWGLLTIHVPSKGRRQIPFGTLRNTLTQSRRDVNHGCR